MSYLAYVPQPPLSDLVDLLWASDGAAHLRRRERILPHGCVEVVISLGSDLLPVYDRDRPEAPGSRHGGLICGPHSEYLVTDMGGQLATMGVAFKPGGALPFMSAPMTAVHNRVVPLELLWGTVVDDVREDLLKARAPQARFVVLERCLLARAVRPLSWHPAVGYALREFRQVPQERRVSDVITRIGISHRRFSQLFQEQVGLSPKLFCRVQRFQHALRLVQHQQPIDWPGVALSCGYFDQAHLIRDFQAFAGLSPGEYVTQRSEYPNHVPIWQAAEEEVRPGTRAPAVRCRRR